MLVIVWDVMASTTLACLKRRKHLRHLEHVLKNEAAVEYFMDSKVVCLQVSRKAPNHPAWVRSLSSHLVHHQVHGASPDTSTDLLCSVLVFDLPGNMWQ